MNTVKKCFMSTYLYILHGVLCHSGFIIRRDGQGTCYLTQMTLFFIFVCISRDLPHKKNPRTLCWGTSSWFYMFLCSHEKRVVDVSGSSCTHGFS